MISLFLHVVPALLAPAPTPTVPENPALVPATPLTDEIAPEDLGRWRGSVSIGASLSSGNTNKRTVTSTADAQRRNEDDRWKANAYWSYADQKAEDGGDWELTERKLGGALQYDRFLTERLFAYVAASGQYDAIAGLDLRTTVGAGLGYQVYEREDLAWAVEGGIAFVDENYEDDDADDEYVAARAASDLRWLVREGVEFLQKVEVFPSLEDGDDIHGRADQRLRVTLTKTLFAQLQYVVEYDNTPAEGKDRLDHLVALTLGWTF